MDRGAWRAVVHRVAKSQTILSNLHFLLSHTQHALLIYTSCLAPVGISVYDQIYVCILSRIRLFATWWTIAHKAPLSMEFSRQEYLSRLPFPTPRAPPKPESNPNLWCLLHWQVDSLPLGHLGSSPMDSCYLQNVWFPAIWLPPFPYSYLATCLLSQNSLAYYNVNC